MKPQLSPKEIQQLHELYHNPDFIIDYVEENRQGEFLDGEDPAEPIRLSDYELMKWNVNGN